MEGTRINELLSKYGMAVPRYTSYPTAPHFRHRPDLEEMAALLREHAADASFSLYVHIPFCHQLCHYCGCFTKVANKDGPVKAYLRLLEREVALAGEIMGHRPRVGSIHFGGGTPNIAAPEDLGRLLDVVRKHFFVAEDAELAMEIDPRLMNRDKAQGYASLGMNRASLGVQDFHEDVQRAINRAQPFDMVERCQDWLRDAGFRGVNFDLMFGLPLQTVDSVAENADKVVSLAPDRVALFGYAHVPWMRPHQKLLEEYNLPGPEERFAQQEGARARLVAGGYVPVGMDHFARPGDPLCAAVKRNFQGYTTDDSDVILGFGLSAISSFPAAYAQNTTDIGAYRAALECGDLPISRGCVLSREDRLRRAVIQNLMCDFFVDAGALCADHGIDSAVLRGGFEKLEGLAADGLVHQDGNRVRVTEVGKPFVRAICACFDYYFDAGAGIGKHAKAV